MKLFLLYFPNLILTNDNNYKLDWTGFHKLPEPYEQQIQNLVFKLDSWGCESSYLTEICRTRDNAIHEWGLQKGRFDTSIREMCLEPAITFSQTHFKLLWDCVADTSLRTSYWLRNALLYKMWLGQTGGGCVFINAGLHELNRGTDRLLSTDYEDSPLSEEQYTTLTGLESFRRKMYRFQETPLFGKPYRLSAPEGAYMPETYVSPFTGKEA